MTDREKAIVMAYTGCTMLAGDKLGIYYKYVQEKLGRSVVTHELAYQEVQDAIKEAAKEDFIAIAKADNGWISVQDRLPPEKKTIFAKFKGTDQWNPAMFATSSEDVRVVVRFEDGSRRVWHDKTMDGKWQCEREKCAYPKCTVIHWMPNPELSKEEEKNDP